MKRTWILMTLVAFLAAGCVGMPNTPATPQAKLAAARETFNVTVNVLARYREQGRFTKDQARSITGLVAAGDMALTLWEGALARGEPPDAHVARFYAVVSDLVVIRHAIDGGDHGP